MMENQKKLTASTEAYIRAIYFIVKKKKAARVKDIVLYLDLKPSSVSEALKSLTEKGLVDYEKYGIITFTEQGEKIAENIIKRNKIINNFFENVLSVDPEIAERDASKIEHGMSDEVLDKFVMFLEFMQTCSCKEPKWMKSFKQYSSNEGVLSDKCQNCISAKQKCPDLNNSNCCGMS